MEILNSKVVYTKTFLLVTLKLSDVKVTEMFPVIEIQTQSINEKILLSKPK